MLKVRSCSSGQHAFRRVICTSPRQLTDSRPTTAPKQTPDITSIRSAIDLYEHNTILRNYAQHRSSPAKIAELAEKRAKIDKDIASPSSRLKALGKKLASCRKEDDEQGVQKTLEETVPFRKRVDELTLEKKDIEDALKELALALPNLTSSETPRDGIPRVLSYLNYAEADSPSFDPVADHSVIMQKLGIIDFTSAATATGWGFYYLLNEGALLEQALIQYALSTAMRHGWRIVTPPSVVYSHMADSCGFQPRDAHDEQQIWQIAQPEKDIGKPRRSLAATAEIPLAALYADKDISIPDLPIKLVGSSRCYRAEAGARGVDTKGLYRVHEFNKVEMFAWANAGGSPQDGNWTQNSTTVFDEMVQIQTEILSSLGLPCRVLEMPSSDLGASAYRKIDIEVIFPSRLKRDGGWGELSSVSICTDYQSRRLNTRIKDAEGGRARFPHTINGTALAVPRVLAAIVEHGWSQSDQCIHIPSVLVPFTGFSRIGPK